MPIMIIQLIKVTAFISNVSCSDSHSGKRSYEDDLPGTSASFSVLPENKRNEKKELENFLKGVLHEDDNSKPTYTSVDKTEIITEESLDILNTKVSCETEGSSIQDFDLLNFLEQDSKKNEILFDMIDELYATNPETKDTQPENSSTKNLIKSESN